VPFHSVKVRWPNVGKATHVFTHLPQLFDVSTTGIVAGVIVWFTAVAIAV
jgi:hypothetical protein